MRRDRRRSTLALTVPDVYAMVEKWHTALSPLLPAKAPKSLRRSASRIQRPNRRSPVSRASPLVIGEFRSHETNVSGRVAQLEEHNTDNVEVAGSSPAPSTISVCKIHGEVSHVLADGRYRCRPCRVDAVQRRRIKLKLKAVDYLGGKCQRCGYCKCVSALEFHHKDPNEKDFAIGRCMSWDRIQTELDKCRLYCANCHREVHDEMRKLGFDLSD